MTSHSSSTRTPGAVRKGMSPAESLRVGATLALVVLTAATVVTQVFSTLLINRVAPVGESNAMMALQSATPVLIIAGLLCGVLAGGAMIFMAWREAIARRSSAAWVLGLGGIAVFGSVMPLVTGVFNSLEPERVGQAGSAGCQRAMILLTTAWLAWAVSSFQDRRLRVASGRWSIGARRFDDCMGSIRLSRVVAGIAALVLVAGFASMFVSALETQFHTLDVASRISNFEGRYHVAQVDWTTDVDTLPTSDYWLISLSAAWLVGAAHGLALGAVGLIVFGAFKWLSKRSNLPGLGANLLGLAGGIFVFAYVRHGLAWVFEDEVSVLGLFNLANCGIAILGIIYGSLVAWNIIELSSRDDRPKCGVDLMRVILLSGILLAIGPIERLGRYGCLVVRVLAGAGLLIWSGLAVVFGGGPWEWLGPLNGYWQLAITAGLAVVFECILRVWRRLHGRRSILGDISTIALACMLAAGIVAVLFGESFPETEDHTTRVAILLALVITIVTAYAACLLFTPRSRAWCVRSGVIAVLAVLALTTMISAMTPSKVHSTVRNMMYEHSAVSKNNLECWRRLWGAGWEMPEPRAPEISPPDTPLDSPILAGFRKEKPLVIFIIWDACRPDHMSFHGYERKTTPYLDAMKDRLIRFDTAFSQGTGTSCSMRHLFTGRYSSRYMLKKTGIGPFFTNEMLAGGYHTLHLNIVGSDYNGISEVAFLRDMPEDIQVRVKVERAGEHLKESFNQAPLRNWTARAKQMRSDAGGVKPDRRVICYGEQKPENKIRVLLDYLDNNQAAGTFAYMHMVETHFPWVQREGMRVWGKRQEDVYDSSIEYTDKATAELFDGLKTRGLLDKTIIIIAADHGTGLGDHGKYAGFHPYYEQIHIPLIMHIPGVKGKVVKSLVGLFDVAPMLVNMAAPERLAAREYEAMDLWPLILGGERTASRVIFGLNSFEDCYYRIGTDSLHYIWRRARGYDDLFDYVKDPREKSRRLLEDIEAVNKCRAEMAWFLQQGKGRYLDPLHYKKEDPPEQP
jgi:glucan phosphoethanolaminetransferase (alkaline phosphatase superfamily)